MYQRLNYVLYKIRLNIMATLVGVFEKVCSTFFTFISSNYFNKCTPIIF